MKSTGEVMGTAKTFGKAYDKAQDAAGSALPDEGTAVVDVDVDGFGEYYDLGEFEGLDTAIQRGEVDLLVTRDRDALETAVEEDITYFSTEASAEAALEALEARDDPLDVESVGDRPKQSREWGK
jgi:carbamoyl-phosphate synthase large subunit